ncbi:MAG: serine/threonine-protein kinase, partial [Planctomycetota bacterium]
MANEDETIDQQGPMRKPGSLSAFLRSHKNLKADVSLDAEELEEVIAGPAGEDRYAELGEIARGGMGAILKIVDNDIRRPVAMKVVLGSAGSTREVGKEQLERFVEEAQVTGQLEHPNIVPVHELGLNDEGKVYFTMKLVKGRSLEEILESLADKDPEYAGKYTISHLLQIFLKICDAVAFSHSRGVIHRDLKPENVMVGNFGEVLVMDWGLAKVKGRPDLAAEEVVKTVRTDEDGPATHKSQIPNLNDVEEHEESESAEGKSAARVTARTLDGDVMGTPAYMPPEQARGDVSKIDERSDVFALGAILYKILTHEAPYEGATVTEVLTRAAEGRYMAPRVKSPWLGIPKELQSICLKSMAWAREGRYPSVKDLIEDVRAFMDHRLVKAHRYGLFSRLAQFVRRHPAGSMASAVALVLLSLGSTASGLLWARAEASAAKAREETARAETQRLEAQAQELRAAKAVEDKRVAEVRAVSAEAMLEKGRKVSALLRSAQVELGEPLRELQRMFHSDKNHDEKRAAGGRILPRLEAFERTVPSDSASRAAWLAAKGWIFRLASRPQEALAMFDESRKADADVAYGWLFEAMFWLSKYVGHQPIPVLYQSDTGVTFEETPEESKAMEMARGRLEKALKGASSARVWGEAASREFEGVLEGFRGLHLGDATSAEKGLTSALGL